MPTNHDMGRRAASFPDLPPAARISAHLPSSVPAFSVWRAVGSPNAIVELFRTAGLDVDSMLRDVGLESASLDRPVPAGPFQAFCAAAFERMPANFGLVMGATARSELMDVVGFAGMSARTLGDGLARIARYGPLMSRDKLVLLASSATTTVVRFELADPSVPYSRQRSDSQLASLIAFACRFTGEPVNPLRISVQHARPDYHADYVTMFGCPIEYGHSATEATLQNSDLARPLISANEALSTAVIQTVEAMLEGLRHSETMALKARNAIRAALPGGLPNVGQIARALAMSERTLQRLLLEERTSFQALTWSVQLELAQSHLRSDNLSIEEIAYQLGFSHPSSFVRAFKRATNATPREYRIALRANDVAASPSNTG